ncbi:unnamed protein product [Adineta ricciae]|uniref:VWFA domain-containing protein n=1 Tax=Adineta ricciae TaxID=249248 RepID=A0A814MJM2_ADIRI|nr:unnamed protein product [Adineta ricciae]CAF1363552.1 unnamed protein product [Adineta ricciae]
MQSQEINNQRTTIDIFNNLNGFDDSIVQSVEELEIPSCSREGGQRSEIIRHDLFNSYNSLPESNQYQPERRFDVALRHIADKYEIREQFSQKLPLLEHYKIIIVCDDSGSMKTPVEHTNETRWDELCKIVKTILEIAVIFDSNGVDIHFLNRSPMLHVTDPTLIDEQFSIPPRGFTPLVPVLTRIFSSPEAQRGRDKKFLVFVATDGTPTDNKGNVNIDQLEDVMTRVRNAETTHVMFLICTDDPACVEYLVGFDKRMANVDVTDDFFTEREKVWKKNGPAYPFSRGEYIAKTLLGAIDPEIDAINDTP